MKEVKKTSIPNIIMWSWMRTVLDLTGTELLIFAFVFSQTFDNLHKCYTCLSEMENWFGITRQTISRNIDNLCAKGFVEKETLHDIVNPMIKHNSYKVCVPYITRLCENSDYNSYTNFLDSYGAILKQKFPEDSKTIDQYLESLSTWHKNKDIEVTITLNELAQLICSDSNEEHENYSIANMLKNIRKNKVKKNPEYAYINKDKLGNEEHKQEQNVGFNFQPKQKRTSTRAKKEEWDKTKREMVHNFVYMRLGGNEELFELLNNFLDTDNGKSYTPAQWSQQLDNLYEKGRTIERMIDGVKTSYMNNYRSLYIADKSEVDIDLKLREIKRYVDDNCEGNAELKDLLEAYVTEVPKGKSYTVKQFKLALSNLSMICKTTEEKINSVKTSYANSYSALAYANNFSTNSSTTSTEVDVEKKVESVKNFIANGYYYLCDGLEDALMCYVQTTQAGKSVSAQAFDIMLSNLRIFCLDDADKVSKVNMAIQNNSTKFATEDFEETKQIKSRLQTRESVAQHLDRSRKLAVIKEKQKNPKNEKLIGVTV